MKKVIVVTEDENADKIHSIFESLDFYVVKHNNISSIIEAENPYQLSNDDFFLVDGKNYFELDEDLKDKFKKIYKNSKLVFTGEFSDSYLFKKALDDGCAEFIITPFGVKEASNLIERLKSC